MNIIALLFFLICWLGLEFLFDHSPAKHKSLSSLMAKQRLLWMYSMAKRDLRMIDTQILFGQQPAATFFVSACILAIGGTFGLLGATDTILKIYDDFSIAENITRKIWEIQVIGFAFIFTYAFFKFFWSFRLFNYCSILVGVVPNLSSSSYEERKGAAHAAAQMNIIASRHFTAGLRGIFFALAYLGWFLGSHVLIGSTIFVVFVLLRRQYISQARKILVKLDE